MLVTQSCPALCDPMDYSLPGSSVHGILQARILEWVAIPFSRGSSQPRDQTQVSCISGKFFTIWASLVAQTVKKSVCNVGGLGLILGLGRSPGEWNGNPLQYSCLENPTDRGAWWATGGATNLFRSSLRQLLLFLIIIQF